MKLLRLFPFFLLACGAVESTSSFEGADTTETRERLPEGLPSEAARPLALIAGSWRFASSTRDSNCGPNADAAVHVYGVHEAEWDTPGDIVPTGASAFIVSVQCTDQEGGSRSYAIDYVAPVSAQMWAVPNAPSETVCHYHVDWPKDCDPKVDTRRVYCFETTFEARSVRTVTKAYVRNDGLPPVENLAYVPADYHEAPLSSPCRSSIGRTEDGMLDYTYECNGVSGAYSFSGANMRR